MLPQRSSKAFLPGHDDPQALVTAQVQVGRGRVEVINALAVVRADEHKPGRRLNAGHAAHNAFALHDPRRRRFLRRIGSTEFRRRVVTRAARWRWGAAESRRRRIVAAARPASVWRRRHGGRGGHRGRRWRWLGAGSERLARCGRRGMTGGVGGVVAGGAAAGGGDRRGGGTAAAATRARPCFRYCAAMKAYALGGGFNLRPITLRGQLFDGVAAQQEPDHAVVLSRTAAQVQFLGAHGLVGGIEEHGVHPDVRAGRQKNLRPGRRFLRPGIIPHDLFEHGHRLHPW